MSAAGQGAPRVPAPTTGEVDDALIFERASATPDRPLKPRDRTRGAAPAAAGGAIAPAVAPATGAPLRALEEWFAAVTTHPEGPLEAASEADIARLLTSGPHMTALERVGIYHYGYRARLVECLADDYPALKHALGDDAFEALCADYIATHPSRGPSLNVFGRHMAAFCRGRQEPWKDFAADLAALEWALVEVIHAAPAPVLSLEALSAVSPERWAGARLPPSETLRRLRFDYPVNAYFQRFREGDAPSIPGREPSATAIYRRGFTVWRMDLTPAMAGVLDDLAAGKTLGESLEAIAAHAESSEALKEAEESVMIWFREWVAGGFFAEVVV